ncbi:MAG: ketol-acid reductoisomerase [Candidatus Geothermarchaeales archaeon]
MAKIYKDADVSLDALRDKVVAVIGYGSQGKPQSQNMRDSGLNVIIGAGPRERFPDWDEAERDGFEVYTIEEAAKRGDVVHILLPDMVQLKVYERSIHPNLREGVALGFSHGFNIHYGVIKPPKNVDVILVAPKSPGQKLRDNYVEGYGVPSLVAVYQNFSGKAWEIVLAMAKGIGSTRAGVIETTFKEEVETDLIGEQCVLVGGLVELIKNGFEVLVEMGYQPEVVYFEVLNEAKLIMDLIYSRGIVGMLKNVSETARHGGLTVGPRVIDEAVKESMRKAAERVVDGSYAKEWAEEYAKGEKLPRLVGEIEAHQIEAMGGKIRKMLGLE